jgi:hypothetical protein
VAELSLFYGLIIKLGINVIDTYNFSNTILELNVRTHTEMPRIICLSSRLALSVADEGYSRNASCALNLISTFSLRQAKYASFTWF